eukprot:2281936-Amphidinium_carterae.1
MIIVEVAADHWRSNHLHKEAIAQASLQSLLAINHAHTAETTVSVIDSPLPVFGCGSPPTLWTWEVRSANAYHRVEAEKHAIARWIREPAYPTYATKPSSILRLFRSFALTWRPVTVTLVAMQVYMFEEL